ncbi:MAG: ribonuclease III [Acidobacteria bacterium]|nr:ribonuclease III [Acidobacteriota bacterium]
MTGERAEQLHRLERRLGYHFADLDLLDRALTHASHANEDVSPAAGDNEPLEFLGDSVLGLVVTDLLHLRDPDGAEGPKSRHRARLVSAPSLARRAADLGLPALLRLGRGEEKTGGRQKSALWANAYEALIAALFLDGGFEVAHRFVRDEFAGDVENGDVEAEDAKSALQELLQGRGRPLPKYRVAAEEGPSHRRSFRVECRLDDGQVTEGRGTSKKAAQQQAAERALDELRRGDR